MAASPTGTLIQNTQRQLNWTRLPPITGPSAAPSAPSADQVPRACGLARGGTAASTRDNDAGTIRPGPGRLEDPGRDQRGDARRQAAQHRAKDERGEATDQHPAAPDPVGPPASGNQHRREDDRVRVEHPGQRAQAGARVLPADVGEREIDDEQIQAGHEHRQGQDAHDRGHLAAAAVPGRLRGADCGRCRRCLAHHGPPVSPESGPTVPFVSHVRPEFQLTSTMGR